MWAFLAKIQNSRKKMVDREGKKRRLTWRRELEISLEETREDLFKRS